MLKVFISHPMSGKTDNDILLERQSIKDEIQFTLGEEVEIVDSFMKKNNLTDLEMLGSAIQKMGEADIVYFAEDWEKYRGCKIEHECALKYDKTVMYSSYSSPCIEKIINYGTWAIWIFIFLYLYMTRN